jgi:hypothetical protein
MVFGIRKPETASIISTIPRSKNPTINPSSFRRERAPDNCKNTRVAPHTNGI